MRVGHQHLYSSGCDVTRLIQAHLITCSDLEPVLSGAARRRFARHVAGSAFSRREQPEVAVITPVDHVPPAGRGVAEEPVAHLGLLK
jgi:hypothetical protein